MLSHINSSEPTDVILKCTAKVNPKKPALQPFYSFYKDNHVVQNRSHSPIFFISEAKEENSGLYHCIVDIYTEVGIIQKKVAIWISNSGVSA